MRQTTLCRYSFSCVRYPSIDTSGETNLTDYAFLENWRAKNDYYFSFLADVTPSRRSYGNYNESTNMNRSDWISAKSYDWLNLSSNSVARASARKIGRLHSPPSTVAVVSAFPGLSNSASSELGQATFRWLNWENVWPLIRCWKTVWNTNK